MASLTTTMMTRRASSLAASSSGRASRPSAPGVALQHCARVALLRGQTSRPRVTARVFTKRDSELTVIDVMQPGRTIFTCKPDDSVETALELLVHHRVSGLPVVDMNNVVIGVVSDYDLLALDLAGKSNDSPLFPPTDETWQAFKMVKSALAKGSGKKVRDVMTRTPLTVKISTSLNEATSLLLTKRIRRLPVVDEAGRLVGIISRSNIIRTALEQRRHAMASASSPTAM